MLQKGGFPTLNKAFGCKVATKEDKPTNGEFVAYVVENEMQPRTERDLSFFAL